jgi:hypothetical protein
MPAASGAAVIGSGGEDEKLSELAQNCKAMTVSTVNGAKRARRESKAKADTKKRARTRKSRLVTKHNHAANRINVRVMLLVVTATQSYS